MAERWNWTVIVFSLPLQLALEVLPKAAQLRSKIVGAELLAGIRLEDIAFSAPLQVLGNRLQGVVS